MIAQQLYYDREKKYKTKPNKSLYTKINFENEYHNYINGGFVISVENKRKLKDILNDLREFNKSKRSLDKGGQVNRI